MPVTEDTTEVWRPVVGYEGLYQVSNLGQVRGDPTRRGVGPRPRILKQGRTNAKTPYRRVGLSRPGRVPPIDRVNVHVLVAAAFLGPCPAKQEVNHKNTIKTDNRADNLEYLTRSGNNRHAARSGLYDGSHKLTVAKVREIRDLLSRKVPKRQIAERFDVTPRVIYEIFNGNFWRGVT